MNVEQELLDLISQRTGLPVSKITDDLDFEKDLNLSSDELVDFVSSVEEKFNVTFSDETLEEVKTVGDLKQLALDQLEILT